MVSNWLPTRIVFAVSDWLAVVVLVLLAVAFGVWKLVLNVGRRSN